MNKTYTLDETVKSAELDRRTFIGSALAVAGAGISSAMSSTAHAQQATQTPVQSSTTALRGGGLFRAEVDIADCEVEGKIPSELSGAFYRVGPDFQYRPEPRNIPFDGEGHASMFRIHDGRVSFRSRYIRNERYLAQDKARRNLFPMYRNPYRDDPSAKGLSRSTANTHVIHHKNLLLCLKEDSPPTALDLLTLDTVESSYTFGGKLPSKTFTAHPKVDPVTGNIIAFGYEAKGHGTDDVSMFEISPSGEIVWNAWIKVPYVCMLHDFAVTEKHILFFVYPMAIDEAQMQAGGIHWSWDGTRPTYFGVVRRGGDGKDVRWFKGPTRSSIHTMNAFADGEKVYLDLEFSDASPFAFMPNRDGSPWNPATGVNRIHRLSVDLSKKRASSYGVELTYPNIVGALPRVDDRYHGVPYRYGYLPCRDPNESGPPRRGSTCYVRFDHQTRQTQLFNAGANTSLAECVFAPRSANAPEGDGFLMGVATRQNEAGRTDLIILDAQHLSDGPVATVKLPIRVVGQIHGWWTPESALPT